MSQTYFAILTAVGEAKLANAAALGTKLQISRMAVGDGNGNLPVPIRTQTALVHETYRADLNELKPDPANASQIIAELVIPETEGGYWLREMGLYDVAGDLIAVANCPPSYKPEMAEGSGRTQVLRMVLIVSSTAAVQLKIDPSVVLATRAYADSLIAVHMAAADPHPQYKTEVATETLRGVLRVGTQAEVDAGELDDVAVTPKKMSHGLLYSFGTSGYFFLPSWLTGFGFQWALVTMGGATVNPSWPMAFPTACFFACPGQVNSPSGSIEYVQVTDKSVSGVTAVPYASVGGVATGTLTFSIFGFGR